MLLVGARTASSQASPPTTIDSASVALDTVALVPETTLTLAEAIAGAVRTSPVAAAASADVRVSQSSERVALGEYLPSLAATTAWLHNGTPELGNFARSTSLTGMGGPPAIALPTQVATSTTTPISGVGTSTNIAGMDMVPTLRAQQTVPPVTTVPGVPGGAPFSNAYGTISAGWDVFTAGRRPADVGWARDRTRAARSGEVEQHFALVGLVKTTFYNVMRDEDLEEVARVQLRRASEDLRVAQHRRAAGTATPADVLQFELNLNAARQALLQAITNRRSDAYALGRLAGLTGAAEATREGTLDPTPLALSDSAIMALAATNAPMLVAARDSARAADAAIYAARTAYVPVVRVGASYTVERAATVFSTLRPGWAFDVGTVFPIFNGFVREDVLERAAALRSVAHVAARDAERSARAQAEALVGAVHLAVQQIRLAQVSVTAARENYRVEQARYGVGAATVLDLAVAEQNATIAENGLVNAHYNYQLVRANLATLVGREL